jgi:hypothetical protein
MGQKTSRSKLRESISGFQGIGLKDALGNRAEKSKSSRNGAEDRLAERGAGIVVEDGGGSETMA